MNRISKFKKSTFNKNEGYRSLRVGATPRGYKVSSVIRYGQSSPRLLVKYKRIKK